MAFNTETTGVYPIAPTPFLQDGAVDFESLDRLVDFYRASGATGITILGIMGEAAKLEPDEARAIARRVIARAGLPIVVGVAAPGFAGMRALAREAMDNGAAGVMVGPTPQLRTDEQILAWFANAVEAIGPETPWVLQDYPLTLTCQLSVSVISQIMQAHPSCVMLKAEDWPGLEKISALRKAQAEGWLRPFSILTANGGLFLDLEFWRGANGSMTGYAFPDMLVDLYRLQEEGAREAAHDLFDAHLPLIRMEQQPGVGLGVRKHLLMQRGLISHDLQRRPGPTLTPAARDEISYLLERLARKDPRAKVA